MEKALRRALIALAILLACCSCALALDPSLDISQYAHTAWLSREGFPKGVVESFAQTPDGYLWLGTEFGLLRFDGVRAVPWQPPAGEHLPGSEIRSLIAARDGTLWIGIGTNGGLASWKEGKLTQYPEFAGKWIGALFEARNGTVWAAAWSRAASRLCAIDSGNVRCFGEDGSFGNYPVYSLFEDSRRNLWAGTMTGVWRWNPGPPKFYPMPATLNGIKGVAEGDNGALLVATGSGIMRIVDGKVEAYPLPGIGQQFKPVSLLRDREGSLWMATSDHGLLHFHQGRTDRFAQPGGLSDDSVAALFEDREGNIWAATYGGLDRFRDFAVATISVKQGLSNAWAGSVVAAGDGSVWLGTGDGLDRWKDGQITIYRKRSAQATNGSANPEHGLSAVREVTDRGLPDDFIGSLFQDNSKRIWVSTPEGVARFENDHFTPVRSLPTGRITSITENSVGDLWISYFDQGLFHLSRGSVVKQFPSDELRRKDFALTLLADPVRGGLWLGFWQGGLAYFLDGRILESYTAAEGLGPGRVNSLQSDPDGTLWAGTEGGLSRVKNGRVATLSSRNGLPCDSVHWMIEDDTHSVWLYMACGLVRITRSELDAWVSNPKRTIQETVFDSFDGVRSHVNAVGYSPRVAKSTDGKLWFTPWEGVSVVDPRHLPFNKVPPPVHIEQISADDKTYDVSNELQLPARVRDVTIDYTALSLVVPEKVHFRVKLEGQDRDWRELINDRRVHYTNLPPRHYRFRVIACNNSGVWNGTGASLDFAIAPAYYQTTWFRALCVAAFLALLWVLHRLRVRQLRQEEIKVRNVIETIPTFAWTALQDGSVDFVNRYWKENTGLSTEKTVGWGWQEAVHTEDLKRFVEKWRASVASGDPFESEVRFRRADGEYRWFLSRAVPLRDQRGKVVKWYGTSTDIEDRKRAEQLQADLAHVSRVSMMGELSASLAHEIKQPIAATVVNADACLQFLKHEKPDLEDVRQAASGIAAAAMRAGDIIDRLRSLYTKSPPKHESVQMNEIIQEMVPLLRGEANRYAVSIRTDLAADLPKLEGDRVQLQQVLMNLMLNAIEAMKETGGVLTVKSQLSEDGKLLISVSDTGVGLPVEKPDQMFDTFFTTKPQGSGMGLAISRSIIESHGGRLWATPNDGRGATFHFTLPTAAYGAKVPATGHDSVSIRTSHGDIE